MKKDKIKKSLRKVVDVGEVIELRIISIGKKKDGSSGDGVGKIEGMIIFVPETEIDRIYEVQIVNVKEKYAFGRVLREIRMEEQ